MTSTYTHFYKQKINTRRSILFRLRLCCVCVQTQTLCRWIFITSSWVQWQQRCQCLKSEVKFHCPFRVCNLVSISGTISYRDSESENNSPHLNRNVAVNDSEVHNVQYLYQQSTNSRKAKKKKWRRTVWHSEANGVLFSRLTDARERKVKKQAMAERREQ